MWTRYWKPGVAALGLLVFAAGVLAVDHTVLETVNLDVGPGTPGEVEVEVTQTGITHQTAYTDTLSASRGWVTISENMTDVASWFVQIVNDSTANVAEVRLITGAAADSIDLYVDQLVRIYQPPDSLAANRITAVKLKNTFYGDEADSLIPMIYHVIVVGK